MLADEKAPSSDPTVRCCTQPPAVIEFDPEGNFVRGWGGPGQGYDWPKNEHGLYVDPEGNVWVAGNDATDNMILKFTREGKFLMQIGKPGKSEGSNSKTQLGPPANMVVDAAANELYVADGYGNKRIVVLRREDRRLQAALGRVRRRAERREDAAVQSRLRRRRSSSANAVHCVRLSNDGLVYVCDRGNNRIQVFRKDGTFVTELLGAQIGRDWTRPIILLSADAAQRHIYLADGQSGQIHILSRSDGKLLGSFARHGRYAGEFRSLHNLAIDSKGNIYTGEAGFGRRVQKFVQSD